MANFDSDDALGDLLSDGSNDSFFEEPKVLAKRASLTKTPDKQSIADLFGLDAEDKPKERPQGKEEDWLGLGNVDRPKTVRQEPAKAATKKITSDKDNDNILDVLGFDDKKTEAPPSADLAPKKMEPGKKSALMESIFGPPKPREQQPTTFDDILRDSKLLKQKSEEKTEPAAGKPLPPPPPLQPQPQQPQSYAGTEPAREGRRSRRPSFGSALKDPLGLFSAEPVASKEVSEPPPARPRSAKQPLKPSRGSGEGDAGVTETETLFQAHTKDLKTKSAPNIKDLPEWLSGGSPIKTHKSETIVRAADKVEAAKETETREERAVSVEGPALETLLTQQKLATSHIEYQNTSIALQQQESQLLMALQLKKYEENMSEMQRKQQEVLVKQEQQFNSLLERQFAKQQIMENNMRLQQERINNHIQLLISQPPVSGRPEADVRIEEVQQLKKTNAEENSRLYEEMITTLKQRQHEEIFLLNESYKKQITLLENSMESVETRLKSEFTSLSEQFQATMEQMKKEHESEIDKYKKKIEDVSVVHANEIKLMRDNHNRIIDEIRYEYSTMVENMKQIKRAESSVLENANSYSQKLENSLEVLDGNARVLNEMRSRVEQNFGALNATREESLKAKEEEIRLTRFNLEKSREATENERAQLMAVIRNLELKLVEQTQNSKEEQWALQQATAVLTARSAAFDRETEFTRAGLEREKDQLKTLKETMLAEQQKLVLQLTEEKLAVSAEKSRLETAAKLGQNYDNQRARAEIDAAIQVAREAAELTDREREELHRKQGEVEVARRNLADKEKKLGMKEKEVEGRSREAEQKIADGERAMAESRALEGKYNSRLRDIQGQLVSLTSREKKLAEEKIALSKERLALHNKMRGMKKCELCAGQTGDDSPEADLVEQDFSPRMFAITDPDILRLRYEIGEERLQIEHDSLK